MVGCSVCARPDLEQIDLAVRGGTSLRQIAKTFGVGRTAIAGHARHRGQDAAAPQLRTASASSEPADNVRPAAPDLQPIQSADDVVADLQRLRAEAFGLFESAKARSDWKQAQMLFNQLVALVDRFGEMHKVLGPKGGVNVNVDARSIKVAQFYDSLPTETLRRLKSGEITIEAVLGGAEALQG